MDIKIKYFNGQTELVDIDQGDWIDIPLPRDVGLLGEPFKLIPLGVAMKLPKGYEAHIAMRSSTFKNWGIIQTNGIGIVDESYCGDNDQWMLPVYRLHAPIIRIIPKGTRLCQFRIIKKQPKIEFKIVDELIDKDRGGVGSTGK